MSCSAIRCDYDTKDWDYMISPNTCCYAPITASGRTDIAIVSSYTKIQAVVCSDNEPICGTVASATFIEIKDCPVSLDSVLSICQQTSSTTRVRILDTLYDSDRGYIIAVTILTLALVALIMGICWSKREKIGAWITRAVSKPVTAQVDEEMENLTTADAETPAEK